MITGTDTAASLTERLRRKLRSLRRRLRPSSLVHQDIQGVRLAMPRQHLLPDIVERFPAYGQNLVALARGLVEPGQPLGLLDIGANIGDSTAQVLAEVDGRAWCIEADPFWLPFLERNVGGRPDVWTLPALLVPEASDEEQGARVAVRAGGTTTFRKIGEQGSADSPVGSLPVDRLSGRYPLGTPLRLVKSDTDGYDARLVPAVARAFAADRPVLFFEYDPPMSVRAGDEHPEAVWDALADLGYDDMLVWDNFGDLLGSASVSGIRPLLVEFDRPPEARGWNYWDVAVAHREDDRARRILDELCGSRGPFHSRGA